MSLTTMTMVVVIIVVVLAVRINRWSYLHHGASDWLAIFSVAQQRSSNIRSYGCGCQLLFVNPHPMLPLSMPSMNGCQPLIGANGVPWCPLSRPSTTSHLWWSPSWIPTLPLAPPMLEGSCATTAREWHSWVLGSGGHHRFYTGYPTHELRSFYRLKCVWVAHILYPKQPVLISAYQGKNTFLSVWDL